MSESLAHWRPLSAFSRCVQLGRWHPPHLSPTSALSYPVSVLARHPSFPILSPSWDALTFTVLFLPSQPCSGPHHSLAQMASAALVISQGPPLFPPHSSSICIQSHPCDPRRWFSMPALTVFPTLFQSVADVFHGLSACSLAPYPICVSAVDVASFPSQRFPPISPSLPSSPF